MEVPRIRSTKDLELMYLLLRSCDVPHEIADKYKRAIREYTHREKDRRVIGDDGIDGYTVLIALPDSITGREEAEEHFYNNEYRECLPSMYDCTGQAFTLTHRVVERRGRWYCYHTVRFDV